MQYHAIMQYHKLYIPSKDFRLVDLSEVAKIYIIRARVFVSVIFFAGYLQYPYCINTVSYCKDCLIVGRNM